MEPSGSATATRYFSEVYSCADCELEFDEAEIARKWKCPECSNYVLISADNEAGTLRFQVTRKAAKEVTLGEFVHLPGALEDEPHEVMQIRKGEKHLIFSLLGFGRWKVNAHAAVVCREGSW